MQHIAKDKVTGGTVSISSISQDLSLLWPQISSSHPKNPKFIGIVYWVGFGRMKVLGQGPVVCLRIITRHLPSSAGFIGSPRTAVFMFSPSPLGNFTVSLSLMLPKCKHPPVSPRRLGGTPQASRQLWAFQERLQEIHGQWLNTIPRSHGWRLTKFYLSLRTSQWKELSTGQEILELRPINHPHAALGTVSCIYHLRPSEQGYKVSWSICEHISALHWCKHFTQIHHQSKSQPRQVYRSNGQLLSIVCSHS